MNNPFHECAHQRVIVSVGVQLDNGRQIFVAGEGIVVHDYSRDYYRPLSAQHRTVVEWRSDHLNVTVDDSEMVEVIDGEVIEVRYDKGAFTAFQVGDESVISDLPSRYPPLGWVKS